MNGFGVGVEFSPAVREQQLYKRVEELQIRLGRLESERVELRAVDPDAVHPSAIQGHLALIATANIEHEAEPVVLLTQCKHLVRMDALAGSGWPDDEHHANTIDVNILKERRACSHFEHIQTRCTAGMICFTSSGLFPAISKRSANSPWFF